MDAAGLLVANVCFLAAGAGVAGFAGWWSGGRGACSVARCCYLVGVAAFGMVAQLLYVLGASLARWEVIGVCALLAIGSIRAFRRNSVEVRPLGLPWWVVRGSSGDARARSGRSLVPAAVGL